MGQRRVIVVFLCLLPVLGCTLSTSAPKVHHHGARINIADFIHHTAAYKGKTITIILKMDQTSVPSQASPRDHAGQEVQFTTVGPKGEQLKLVIAIPQELSLPNVGPSDDVMVTFVCTQGSLRQGNQAKAVQIPDGTEDD